VITLIPGSSNGTATEYPLPRRYNGGSCHTPWCRGHTALS
jgi:hypothetical protein